MTKDEEIKYNATEAGLINLDAVVDEFKAGNIAYINYDGEIERKGRNLSESLLWLGKHHFASMTAADRALTALHAGLSVKENSELGWALWCLCNKQPKIKMEIDLIFADDEGWFYRLL